MSDQLNHLSLKKAKQAANRRWPGAVLNRLRLYGQVREVFRIRLKNGVSFDGRTPSEALCAANTYAEGVKNLTGEYP